MENERLKKKLWWTWLGIRNIGVLLLRDLWDYYVTPYPFQLIRGSILRLIRRLKVILIPKPKSKGRPRIADDVIDLILEMKRANWGWGSLRISNELRMLGIRVSKTSVLKILKMNGLVPPRTRFTPVTWSAFLKAYKSIWFADFTTIFDTSGNQVFIFNILDGITQELVLTNATLNPTRTWVLQQIRNSEINGFILPEAFVHDRDAIFGKYFDKILKNEFGVLPVTIDYKSPWQQGKVERFHLTMKIEMLDRIPMKDSRHARELCAQYQIYYNACRTHQSIAGKFPNESSSESVIIKKPRCLQRKKVVNGLITTFSAAA